MSSDGLNRVTVLPNYSSRTGTTHGATIKDNNFVLYQKQVESPDFVHELRGAEVFMLSPDDEAAIFKLVTTSDNKCYIMCETEQEATHWVKVIQETISSVNSKKQRSPAEEKIAKMLEDYRSQPHILQSEEISLGTLLGAGAFGKVYRGACRGTPAAIKVLHNQTTDSDTIEEFVHEINVLSSVHHPNVLMYLGACLSPLIIVSELMMGNLSDICLKNRRPYSLPFWLKLAKGCALGINWLHSLNPIIIHHDIKPENFLVDDSYRVVVSDFGLSETLRPGTTTWETAIRGNLLYAAPEVLKGTEFNEKCDVYSLGLLIWSILIGKQPYEDILQLTDKEFIEKIVWDKVRPSIPRDWSPLLVSLLQGCWETDSSKRPSSLEVSEQINKIISSVVVHDEGGLKFWQDNFGSLDSVQFREFLKVFLKNIHTDQNLNRLLAKLLCMTGSPDPNARVTYERFGKILDWFGPFHLLVENMQTSVNNEWFFGDLSLHRVLVYLSEQQPGTFLLRFSSTLQSTFIINFVDKHNTIGQILIEHSKDSGYSTFIVKRSNDTSTSSYSTLNEAVQSQPEAQFPCPQSPFKEFFCKMANFSDSEMWM